jgi:hypothetical protein
VGGRPRHPIPWGVEGRAGWSPFDRRDARWWREARRARIVEEAQRARSRAIFCEFYGLSPAEHDDLTFEELELWHEHMSGGGHG